MLSHFLNTVRPDLGDNGGLSRVFPPITHQCQLAFPKNTKLFENLLNKTQKEEFCLASFLSIHAV